MEVYPIKTEADYKRGLSDIEKLWGAKESTKEGEKLDILLTLVDAYEEKYYPIDPPAPVDALKFRMEQMNLTRKDPEPFIGKRGRVSEILNHKRNLTLNMIKKLHANLHIHLESLIWKPALKA